MKTIASLIFALMITAYSTNARAEGSFEIQNNTSQKITKLLLSEDKKKWGGFDLGGGVAAGQTARMEWNEEAAALDCKLHCKAVYEDESESEPAIFDFCEAGVELVFEE